MEIFECAFGGNIDIQYIGRALTMDQGSQFLKAASRK